MAKTYSSIVLFEIQGKYTFVKEGKKKPTVWKVNKAVTVGDTARLLVFCLGIWLMRLDWYLHYGAKTATSATL